MIALTTIAAWVSLAGVTTIFAGRAWAAARHLRGRHEPVIASVARLAQIPTGASNSERSEQATLQDPAPAKEAVR